MPVIFIPAFFWLVCAIEWVQRKFVGANPDPRFWALTAAMATLYGGFQVFRLRPRLRNLRVGEKGERRVAEILDRTRSNGFVIYHDLPGKGFNIDHVAVGPSGVYAIETKTRSGSGTIIYRNDNELLLGARISDSPALRQARGSARAIHDELKEHLHATYWVKPVLVFLGNWKVRREAGDFLVDVVTADHLESYFDRQQPELTRREIAQICSHLERSARS